ncbi:MAG: hypothetical protein IKK21_03645 [Clostridia bacterium]|nr:hypothetical protein [Clostridia bacterium]
MQNRFHTRSFFLLGLVCLLVCLFALPAASHAAENGKLVGDLAYIKALTVIEESSLTGTAPFDADDAAGNDSTSANRIVRSHDTVLYKLYFETEPYNSGDSGQQYTEARVCFCFVLDAPADKAEFVLNSMSWVDQSEKYRYRLVESGDKQFLYCSYVMRPAAHATGDNAYVVPGVATLDVAVYVKNMINGSTLQPTFYAWLEDNNVHNDGWTPDKSPYSQVNIAKPCENHNNRVEVVEAQAFPVTVSAKLKLNVALNDLQTAGYWVGDFGTGNPPGHPLPAPNYEEGKVVSGLDAHVGITVQLQNDSKEKGLKGLEFPDGSPISFDIQFAGSYTLDENGKVLPITGDGYDFTPLVWSISRKVGHTGAYLNTEVQDGRRINGHYTLVLGKRSEVGASFEHKENFSCLDSGNWTLTQEGNTLHITISDYKFDKTFPITTNWNAPTDRLIDEHIGVFSTGMLSWILPYYNQLDDAETDDNYIAQMLSPGSFSLVITEGNLTANGYTSRLTFEPSGSAPTADNQMNTDDDSKTLSTALTLPGQYTNCVQFVQPFGFGNASEWTSGCFDNGRDWAYPGAEMGIVTGLWAAINKGFPDNQVIGYDSFVKLDADVLYPRDALKGSDDPRILGLSPRATSVAGADGQVDFVGAPSMPLNNGESLRIIYAVKTDGENWDSEQEMRTARTEDSDLLWFDTIPAAEARGKIVGMLVQYRGLITGETTYPTVSLGVNVRDDAPLLTTHMITNTLRIWNQGHLRQINSALSADKRFTTVPMRSASNAGYAADEEVCRLFLDRCTAFYPLYTKLEYQPDGSYTGDVSTGYQYGDTVYIMGYKTTVSIDTADHEPGTSKLVYNLDVGQNIADFRVTPSIELARVSTSTSGDVPTTNVTMTVTLPEGLDYIPDSLYWGGEYVPTRHGKQGTVVSDGTPGLPVKLVNGQPASYVFSDERKGFDYTITLTPTINQRATGTTITLVFEGVPLLQDSMDRSAFMHDLFFSTFIQSSSNNTGNSSWELQETATIRGSEEFREISEINGNKVTTSINMNQNSAEGLGEVADRIYNEVDAQLGWKITYANNGLNDRNPALLYSLMPSRSGKTYAFDGWSLKAASSGAELADFTLWYTTGDTTGKDASSYTADDLGKPGSGWQKLTLTSVVQDGVTYYVPTDITPAANATAWILTGPLGGSKTWEIHQTIQPENNQPGDAYQSVSSFRTTSGDALASYATVYVAGREISGVAWYDADRDGVYGNGDTLLSGVTATLYRKDGNAYVQQTTDVAGKPLSPVTTDARGAYRFHRLPEGDYRVVFSGTVLNDYSGVTTWQVHGSNDEDSSDAVLENGQYITKYSATADAITLHSIEYINRTMALDGYLERVTHQDAGFIKDGSVSLTKTVSGGPLTGSAFRFVVTFTFNGQPLREVDYTINSTALTAELNEDGSLAFILKDGETFTFTNLPLGTAFTFSEPAPGEGYTTSWVNGVSSGIVGETASVTCINQFNPASFTPEVRKRLTGVTPPAAQTFNFSLVPLDSRPDSGASVTSTVDTTVQGAGTATFDPITFSKAGTYAFAITESDDARPGYTYDPTVWMLTVVVEDKAGVLTVTDWTYSNDEVTADCASFTNTYDPEDTAFTPTVVKTIEGPQPETPETYHFVMSAREQNGMTLPEATEIDVTGAGTGVFGEIKFTLPGVYTLTIAEVPGDDPQCTYDSKPVTLTITVADRGAALYIASAVYTKDGAPVKAAEFTNAYPVPDVPVTGDHFSALWLPLLLLTGLALLLMKKKQA